MNYEAHARRLELMVRCLNIPLSEDVAAMKAGVAALRAMATLGGVHPQVGCVEGSTERSESSATLPSEAKENKSIDASAAVTTETLPNKEQ